MKGAVAAGHKLTAEAGARILAEGGTAVDACIADGTPFDVEMLLTTPTGRDVWVRVVGEAVRDAQGQVVAIQGAQQWIL